MFKPKAKRAETLEKSIRAALGDPVWLAGIRLSDGGRVTLVIEADPADLQGAEARRLDAESRVRAVHGVSEVDTVLTARATPRPETPRPRPQRIRKGARLSDAALSQGAPGPRPSPPKVDGVARILAVASAKGGVGKSTVAVNLAVALAKAGNSIGLLDIDVFGPSIPTMLGATAAQPDTRPDKKLEPVPAFGLKTMSIGYLSDQDAPMIWRGPIVTSAIRQMLGDVAWGEADAPLDLLILDTPPGTGDAQLALAQSVPLTAALIVTTPQEVALADVRRGAAMFAKTQTPVLGLVETMSWFEDPAGARHALFGEGGGRRTAGALGLPLLAEVPLLQAIREGGDNGRPAALDDPAAAAHFASLADAVWSAISTLDVKPAPAIIFED